MKENEVTNLHCTSTTIIEITFALLYKRPSKDLQKNTAAHIKDIIKLYEKYCISWNRNQVQMKVRSASNLFKAC